MPPDPLTLAAAEQARNAAMQMKGERGRALEHLLKAVMAPADDPDDKLFTPDRSFGSLGAKTTLAARLGLLEPPIETALHAVRSVRNDFAHCNGSIPRPSPHPSGRPWFPSCNGSRLSQNTSRPSSCWSRSWWRPSKPAPCSSSPSLHEPRCDSRAADRTPALSAVLPHPPPSPWPSRTPWPDQSPHPAQAAAAGRRRRACRPPAGRRRCCRLVGLALDRFAVLAGTVLARVGAA